MSKLSISRCRPALVALALATAALATGCVTEVDDSTPTDPTLAQDSYAARAVDRGYDAADLELAADVGARPEADSPVERESLAEDELVDTARELAADIATGQLTDRELVLVVIIASLDDDPRAAWADPVLRAARPATVPLPDIDAEEADFVEPGTPMQQGGH